MREQLGNEKHKEWSEQTGRRGKLGGEANWEGANWEVGQTGRWGKLKTAAAISIKSLEGKRMTEKRKSI